MFKSVGLVARYDKKQALTLAEELTKHMKDKKMQVYIENTLEGKVNVGGDAKIVPLKEMKADFIITIGGDGTILRTCVNLPKPEPPILAVNMGVRGFLTEVEPEEAIDAVDKILTGKFAIEKCPKLVASVDGQDLADALNDVVVSGVEPSKILYMQICKNGNPVAKCEADGLIVSTQKGSTGYSLSAGGPVLDPDLDATVVTPICSLTTFRSLVFPADSKITIELLRPKDILLIVDGNYRQVVAAKKTKVHIFRSKNMTTFIRFRNDFYNRLHSRLQFKGTG